MTALLTQCPHCQTSFRVSNAQMNAAHGLVRCGSCLGVFSASANEIRVRTSDSYIVEEIDPDDDTQQSLGEEREDIPAGTSELPDEDIPLPAELADEFADDAPAGNDPVIKEIAGVEPIDNSEPEEYPEEDPPAVQADEELFDAAPAAAATESVTAEDDIDDETGPEPNPWHGDPVITLGDMRLDELEDEDGYDDESKSESVESSEPQVSEEYDYDPDETTASNEIDDEQQPERRYLEDEEHEEEYEEEYADEVHSEPHRDDQSNEDREPETAPVTSTRHPPHAAEEVTAAPEKHNLHRRLSALADDEFDPVDEDQLETLGSLPVTITHGGNFRGQLVQSLLVLLSLLLLSALPLPWLYAKRDTLATHPRFAFMAPLACKLFTCTPTATLDLGSIYSQQLLVRSHPRYEDALEVSFIFRNDTTLPRPFPLVELAFSDLSNNLLANRLFKPQEYLPAELRQLSEMPAQSTVQVVLELQDPGKEAVNYTVKLHPPTP